MRLEAVTIISTCGCFSSGEKEMISCQTELRALKVGIEFEFWCHFLKLTRYCLWDSTEETQKITYRWQKRKKHPLFPLHLLCPSPPASSCRPRVLGAAGGSARCKSKALRSVSVPVLAANKRSRAPLLRVCQGLLPRLPPVYASLLVHLPNRKTFTPMSVYGLSVGCEALWKFP